MLYLHIIGIINCVVVDCGQPDAADENGRLHVGPTTYLSTALYTCNMGYLLDLTEGAANIVCQSNGVWSDTAPGCTSKYNTWVDLIILVCAGDEYYMFRLF